MRRNLFLAGLFFTPLELGLDALLLFAFFGLTREDAVAALVSLAPILVISTLFWAYFYARWLNGLGLRSTPEAARDAVARFPARALLHRTVAITALGVALAPILAGLFPVSVGSAGIIACTITCVGFAVNVGRALYYRRTLDAGSKQLFADGALERSVRTLRERLFVATNVVGIAGIAAAAIYLGYLVGISRSDFAGAFLIAPEVLALTIGSFCAYLWAITRPLIRFGSTAPERPPARTALRLATSLPYRLAGAVLLLWFVGAVIAAMVYAHSGAPTAEAIRVGLGIAAVSLGLLPFQVAWHRGLLQPLVDAAAAEVAVDGRPERSRISLKAKLIAAFLSLLGFAGAFALLLSVEKTDVPRTLFVFAVLAVASAGMVLVAVRELTAPLHALARGAERIGSGDLARPILPPGADEFGELAAAMDYARRELADKIRAVEELNATLEQRVRERTGELQRSNEELAATLAALRSAKEEVLRAEKLASLGRLVAGVAHEINNPLNFLQNSLPPLKETVAVLASNAGADRTEQHAEAEAILRVMTNGVQRMAGVVRALRDFSRHSEGVVEPVELERLVDDAAALLRHDFKGRIELVKDLAETGPVRVEPGAFTQVFMNLFKNAAQAIDGAGTIRVTSRRTEAGVEIAVADTGCGMAPEVVANLFEPFFTTKPVGEGTGLGLAIVHGIVERHGGRITVHSEPGRGTRFEMTLPGAPA